MYTCKYEYECFLLRDCWDMEFKKKKKKYPSVTRTNMYRTSFRTEITKLINATNKASFTL